MSDLKNAQRVMWDFSDNIVYIYLFLCLDHCRFISHPLGFYRCAFNFF